MSNIPKSIQDFLDEINAEQKGGFDPYVMRENAEKTKDNMCLPKVEIELILDRQVATSENVIPVRIYHPSPTKALPVLFHYHGGGHVIGSIETHDSTCRRLANTCNVVVVAVEYRLAPEHPYPAGLNDCLTVFKKRKALLSDLNVDLNSIFLAGDSAGGNLAVSVAYKAKLWGVAEVKGLILIYPSVDFTLQHDSIFRLGSGYLLEKEDIEGFFQCYLKDTSMEKRKEISPLYFDSLSILPSTYLAIAEFDPLYDEGVLFSQELTKAGVSVKVEIIPGMIHIFMLLEKLAIKQINQVISSINDFIKENL